MAFGSEDLLRLYERGKDGGPLERARLLGKAALGDRAEEAPIGDLDRAVWALRGTLLDTAAEATTTCPGCGTRLEFEIPRAFGLPERRAVSEVTVTHAGRDIAVRLPTLRHVTRAGLDLVALAPEAPWDDPAFRAAAEARIEEADPALAMTLGFRCEACGAQATPAFDALAFVWGEFEAAARRVVADVVALARGYGWREADILAMSALRRGLYLEALER
ncbi:hypothetical protein SAMN05421759_11070 [Roseivivax lentus]|uniref:Phage baseplate protein n=1 Tax=Roseivivax lentus TaxID=633194 RepID=A0A1N7NUJ2_9RHOB|nr:hypothetical protein [Roseivivax lentus]SIT01980.1 hypothetical protein SAMN05421759_11070 [Roseivivax lentus]